MTGPERSRAVITGIGVVSPFGVGRQAFWESIRVGRIGVRAIDEFDASRFSCRVAAPVPRVTDEDLPPFLRASRSGEGRGRPDPRRYSKASRIGVIM